MQLSGTKANGLSEVSDVEKGRLASSSEQQQQSQEPILEPMSFQPSTHAEIPSSPEKNRITTSQSLPDIIPAPKSPSRQNLESPPTATQTSPSLPTRIWGFATRKSGAGKPIDNSDPPDGGVQAWTIVILCHLVGFHTWGFLNAFGVLQSFYVVSLGRSPSDVSVCFLLSFYQTHPHVCKECLDSRSRYNLLTEVM